jgi:hypothetical protein
MPRPKDDMSQIRRRGTSLQVVVFAGRDPITGQRLYLSESTTDLAQAKQIRAQVAEQRSAHTKATFRHAIGEWLIQGPGQRSCRRASRRAPGADVQAQVHLIALPGRVLDLVHLTVLRGAASVQPASEVAMLQCAFMTATPDGSTSVGTGKSRS